MPDGTIVQNVPENITKDQLLAKYHGVTPSSAPTVPLPGAPPVPGSDEDKAFLNRPNQPYPPDTRTFKEKLFGKEGTPLLPGAEPLKWAYENPDVVGATIGSLAAPEFALPAWAMRTGIAGKILPALVNSAPKVGAAAAGGGVGGGVKEAIRDGANLSDLILNKDTRGAPTAQSIMFEAGKSALEMGGAEGAGIAGIGLLGKIAAPGAKVITEQGKKILDFAKENGLKINPSRIAPSGTAKALDEVTDAVVTGRAAKYFLGDKKIAQVLDTTNPEANKLITDVTKVYGENSPGLEPTITSASKAIKQGLEDWQPKVEAKYAKFTQAIGGKDRWTDYPSIRTAMTTIKEAEDKLAGGKDAVTTGFIDNFLGKYPAQASADDLYKQYKRLGHLKGADKRNLGILRDAFKDDFSLLAEGSGGDAAKLLSDANKEYVLGKTYFKNSKVIKDIASGNLEDSKVTVRLFRDGEYGTVKQLQANIPKEHFDNLLRLNLENLIQNNSVAGANPFVKMLDGGKLNTWITKNPKIMKMYPEETQDALKNLALYAKYHAQDALAGSKDIMSAIGTSAVKTGAVGGLMKYAGADLSGAGIVIPSIAAPAMAWDMMRPNGMLTKWLTGAERIGPKTEEGLKLGGRLLFQDSLGNQ